MKDFGWTRLIAPIIVGVIIGAFAIISKKQDIKTIVGLKAERDSLLAAKTPKREVGTALYLPSVEVDSGDKLILEFRVQGSRGDTSFIRRWPPDTLIHKPMKRETK